MYKKGRAWIEINKNNLIQNVREFQKLLPNNCELMPAIKANAYGHGAILIGRALQDIGIHNFCVASIDEAIELRKAKLTGQILILGYTAPEQFSMLSHYDLTQTVVDSSYAKQLANYEHMIQVHIGIDTGMHRLGVDCNSVHEICNIWTFKNLKITGVFSHLCVSDGNSKEERKFTLEQIKKFQAVIDSLHQKGITNFKTHIQGSYGVMNYPTLEYDYARIGIALYGVYSESDTTTITKIELKPVLSLKARITCIKFLCTGDSIGYGLTYTAKEDMKIATVSIGYADGIPRELSNKGYALVGGCKASIIGRICMDQLIIDISKTTASVGDEVVFIGKSNNMEILVSDFAKIANTISNEILSQLGTRLKRIWI